MIDSPGKGEKTTETNTMICLSHQQQNTLCGHIFQSGDTSKEKFNIISHHADRVI